MTKTSSIIFCLTAILAAYSSSLHAQDEARSTDDGYQSGYGNIPEFGGPDGVSGELARNDKKRQSVYDFDTQQRVFSPYFDWKRRQHDSRGISFGIQYYLLPQLATSSRSDKDALGGIFRFQGTWTLFNRGGFHPGRLAFDVYLDAMPFQTIGKGFINRAFILNPTIAITGIGALGAVAKGFVSDQFWIGGQFHDANAINGEFDWDTITEDEWLSAVEIGWTIGAGWARPSEKTHGSGLRDEWIIETSYKFQLSKNFSLTPDLQILFNPANNPGKNTIWVAGVRAILVL